MTIHNILVTDIANRILHWTETWYQSQLFKGVDPYQDLHNEALPLQHALLLNSLNVDEQENIL